MLDEVQEDDRHHSESPHHIRHIDAGVFLDVVHVSSIYGLVRLFPDGREIPLTAQAARCRPQIRDIMTKLMNFIVIL